MARAIPRNCTAAAGEWPAAWLSRSQDWRLAWQLSHLIELGIAFRESNTFRVAYSSFPELFQQGFTLPLLYSTWSPLTLEVTMHGLPAQAGCHFSIRYFLGDLETAVDREGRYIKRKEHEGTWLLDDCGWQLLARISKPARTAPTWTEVAIIRDLSREAGATMHGFIADHEIVFPASLQVQESSSPLVRETTPGIREVEIDTFRRVMRGWTGEATLSFATREGWTHLRFDDEQVEALKEWFATQNFHPPDDPATQYVAGRLSYRETVLGGNRAVVPVRAAGLESTVQAGDSGSDSVVAGSSLRYCPPARVRRRWDVITPPAVTT